MPEKINTSAGKYEIDSHDIVHLVTFCPYAWSSQLFAFATSSRITVGTCQFQVRNTTISKV